MGRQTITFGPWTARAQAAALLRGPCGNATAPSGGMGFRNLPPGEQPFCGRTPAGRKRGFGGIVARFGLGHLEKFRAWAENTKMKLPSRC